MVHRNIEWKRKCEIIISFESHFEIEEIPKLVQIFTAKRSLMFQEWVTSIKHNLGSYYPTIYLLRVTLPSGLYREKVVKLESNKVLVFSFDFRMKEIPTENEWAYFAKPNLRRLNLEENNFNRSDVSVKIRKLTLKNGKVDLETISSDRFLFSMIDEVGSTINIKTSTSYQILEIKTSKNQLLYMRLPPENDVKLLIRKQKSSQPLPHPIEVVASTENWKIEALLQIIKTGLKKLAQDLMGTSNAEELLREKYVDANAAIVGAYYLYLSGTYKKNVQWFQNLANDFPNLPDGPVIYASQLINHGNPSKVNIKKSRDYFLLGAERGIPIYTIGFKMLREGLIKMSGYFNNKDLQIFNALQKFNNYHRMVDYTKDYTTLIPFSSHDEELFRVYSIVRGGSENSSNIRSISSQKHNTERPDYLLDKRIEKEEQLDPIPN